MENKVKKLLFVSVSSLIFATFFFILFCSPEYDVEICKSFCGENFVLENITTEIGKCECEGNCLAWNESKKFIRADGIGTNGKVASLCVKCFC